MSRDRRIEAAKVMLQLGISQAAVVRLLTNYELEVLERQIYYLPYRKAKRPGAFLIEAVRFDYSAPKDLFHAKVQTEPEDEQQLDKSAERLVGRVASDLKRHRAEAPANPASPDRGLEP